MPQSFYDPSPEHAERLSGPWCCSFSGGKDSTSLVTWIEWLRRTEQIDAPKPQLVQSNTRVEDPALSALSREMMDLLARNGWECAVVEPDVSHRLYNRILGIGNTPVHPGGRNMRWCTRATKIDPMKRWRKANSSGFTVTGVRWGESTIRDDKLRRSSCAAGGECGLPDVDDHTYGPIINWRTCHVIDWLNGSVQTGVRRVMADTLPLTTRLVEVYGMRVGQNTLGYGEPEIKAARFGCIGCPAISSTRDAPRATVARNGVGSPLNELYDVWFEARRRVNRCVRIKEDGSDGFGPIRMKTRQELFARVIDIQRRAGVVLVTPEDEAFIRDCWQRKVYPRGWSEADEATVPTPPSHLFDGKGAAVA